MLTEQQVLTELKVILHGFSGWSFLLVSSPLLNFMCLTLSINVNEVKFRIYNHTCDHLFVLFWNFSL
jgi:hypothetical protein